MGAFGPRSDEIAAPGEAGPRLGAGPLRKLLLLCLAGGRERPTPQEAEQMTHRLAHQWEWIGCAAASPERLPLAAARALPGPVVIDPRFGAASLERSDGDERLLEALTAISEAGWRGVLLLCGAHGFEATWRLLLGEPTPAPPRGGTVGLLTRRHGARWVRGRCSSDPPPLRSSLEREGLADLAQLETDPSRHVAPLQIDPTRE
jgi:hypothetical protein